MFLSKLDFLFVKQILLPYICIKDIKIKWKIQYKVIVSIITILNVIFFSKNREFKHLSINILINDNTFTVVTIIIVGFINKY